MGFSIGGVLRDVRDGVKKAVRKIPQETRNFANSVVRTGTALGAAPIQLVGGITTEGIKAAAPALSAATGVLAANPALGNLAGGLIGMPGLGSAFAGDAAADAGAGGFAAPVSAPEAGQPAPARSPWVWVAVAGAAIVALWFLLFRRKGSA